MPKKNKDESLFDESPELTPEEIEKLDQLRSDARELSGSVLFARFKSIYKQQLKRRRKASVEEIQARTICQLIGENNHHLLTYLEDLGVRRDS